MIKESHTLFKENFVASRENSFFRDMGSKTKIFALHEKFKEYIMSNTPKTHKHKQRDAIRYMVFIALFSALAYALTFFFSIRVSFLTFDLKDTLITIASFLFGPLAGVVISLLVATLELVTVSGTGFYGFIMNFASSATFSVVASLVYRHRKTLNNALISMLCAVLSLIGVMMVLNLFVTPFYTGMDRAGVAAMIPTLLFPFNLAKGLVNAAFALLLYKPIATTLRRSGFMPSGKKKTTVDNEQTTKSPERFTFNKGTIIILVIAVVTLVVATIILYTLGAKIQFK